VARHARNAGDNSRHFPVRAWATKSALITDGRFLWCDTRFICVGHVGPEAAHGADCPCSKAGDMITIERDPVYLGRYLGRMKWAERKPLGPVRAKDQLPKRAQLWKYAHACGPTYHGWVTHPGAKAETHDYMGPVKVPLRALGWCFLSAPAEGGQGFWRVFGCLASHRCPRAKMAGGSKLVAPDVSASTRTSLEARLCRGCTL